MQQEVMETQRTEKQGYREEVEKQVVERMQQLQIQGKLLRSRVEVQLEEAEKEFQCVDREPELSNSKGQGEREGESEGRSDEGLQEVPQTTAGPTPELVQLQSENSDLKKKIQEVKFSVKRLEGNDANTKFFTGLPSWAVFGHLFCFLSPHLGTCKSLCPEDQLLIVLMRLRLALFLEDLAQRFSLTISTAHRLLQKGLEVMYTRLSFLIAWPSREVMSRNMPAVVKQLYPACRCIIDCTEVFIESLTNFEARAKVYSHYKNHSTVKFLIGITPCGAISYISRCWGGRVSDKNLTQHSNFLELVEPHHSRRSGIYNSR